RLDALPANDPARRKLSDERDYFINRAQNYVNMFDPSVGFFQGRDTAGNFRMPAATFDPRSWGGDFTETDAWNMAFHVPQDGRGLASLYGGTDKLADKLDQFFATPETAMFPGFYGGQIHEMLEARDVRMGQYGHSNQPSHHIMYMYDYAGQPYKAQAKIREALSRLYLGSEIGQGYTGDEDNGEMSAWYIFSALGFYPLQMGSPQYAIGSPLFTKATVNLENGKKLVINAPRNSAANVYIQGLKVNGKAYGSTTLPHSVLAAGAVLDFDMGPAPSRWGTGAGDAPQSITPAGDVPRPLRDVTRLGAGATGVATASDGADATGLFDNTSATAVGFDSQTPAVQYQLTGARDRVTQYTLTSGPTLGTPRSLMGRAAAVSASTENAPNEVAARAVDGNSATKWLTMAPTGMLTVKMAQAVTATQYSLTSANDAPDRDPRDWTLEGSTDGQQWTALDTQVDQVFGARMQARQFRLANPATYQYFRLNITRNNGSTGMQIAELALSDGVTTGDPTSWVLKGSYNGTDWTVIDQRTGETFANRRQTRPFAIAKPGRYTSYRLEVTRNTGEPSTVLSEVELLAKPAPACTATVSGEHAGGLVVSSGVTCLAAGSVVNGPVTVRPGAALYSVDATIGGPVTALTAGAVVLLHTVVAGPVSIMGTTGEVSLENSAIAGPVSLVTNRGPGGGATLVSSDSIHGPLSCVGNAPQPVNNGLPNTVSGVRLGQCRLL
ncbi:MAG: hypothetical protein QOE03_3789, partial [Micromonosporaceae bacterium]|nr:hypothetical protein [Micromonosporaceae bacterium]